MLKASVWVDPDDDEARKQERLTRERRSQNGDSVRPVSTSDLPTLKYEGSLRESYGRNVSSVGRKWGALLREQSAPTTASSDDTTAGARFLASSARALSQSISASGGINLRYKTLPNVNDAEISQCVISNVGFFAADVAGGNLLYTAGLDKTIRLFDAGERRKVASVFVEKTPIRSAAAATTACAKLFFVGDYKRFGEFDLATEKVVLARSVAVASAFNEYTAIFTPPKASPSHVSPLYGVTADNGNIGIFDNRTNAIVRQYKMNAPVGGAAFVSSERFFSADKEGMIYEWSVSTNRCIRRWNDEGSSAATSVAAVNPFLDQGKTLLAIGSASGYVNLYDDDGISAGKPSKILGNLVTSCNSLQFSQNGRYLAFASSEIPDSIRIADVDAKFQVYGNFPKTGNTKSAGLHLVTSLTFNPNATSIFVGNDRGIIRPYEILV